jgi:FAD/FMN-containing dehydrogenase
VSVQAVAADADATLFGSLDRLHKDSRGLDIAQMLVGSGGTLGIITAAVIALSPLPKHEETWWLALDDAADASQVFTTLYANRPNELSAFEFVSAEALSRTLALDGAPRNPFGDNVPNGAVLVEWSSQHRVPLENIEEAIARLASDRLIGDGVRTDAVSAWGIRHRVSESLRHYGVVLGHDISVPLNALMATRDAAIRAVREIAPHAVVCDFGHIGDGGLHLNVLLPADDPQLSTLRLTIRSAIDEVVARFGGSYSAEHGLGPLNAQRWKSQTPRIEQEIIRSIKQVVDPNHLLGHPLHPYNQLVL